MKKFGMRLLEITAGCRNDMHEPDEQELSARVVGTKLDNAFGEEIDLPMIEAGYQELVVILERKLDKSRRDVRCASCRKDGEELAYRKGGRLVVRVDFYDHDDGWPVIGLPKQWVSVRCRSCGYDTSLNKLKTLEEAAEIRRLRGEEVEP